jgi:D-arabinose 5-phosphate isomerase GutQ
MSTERAALAHLEHLYQNDARAQQDLARAVDLIAYTVREGGKLVVCGVGKSGKIGRKIEATMNSLGIHSAFLHPTEALHGDLGLVRPVSHLHLGCLLLMGLHWAKCKTEEISSPSTSEE